MKILILFLLSISQLAFSSDELFSYYKGNQITGDYLKVYTSGEVRKAQRICCPPSKEWKTVGFLDQTALNYLNALIVEAADGDLHKRAHNGRYGEAYFDVYAFYMNEKIVIKKSTRNSFTENRSKHAKKLLVYAEGFFSR